MNKQLKICFLVPWFGVWPHWMEYYLMSCIANPSVHWHFFSNNTGLPLSANNLFLHRSTLEELNDHISKQLGIKAKITHPYKLCDFKPAFGHIFRDLLKDYDFWGYTDIDLIYGNINHFLPPSVFADYNVISPHSDFIPGHFCLMKNESSLNFIYQTSEHFKEVFESERCFCFDEKFLTKGMLTNPEYLPKLMQKKISRHLFSKKIINHLKVTGIKNLLPTKKGNSSKRDPSSPNLKDFNEIVRFYSQRKEIKVYYDTLYRDDIMKIEAGTNQWEIVWHKGALYDDTEEILYFHFQLSKYKNSFGINWSDKKEKRRFVLKNF